MTTWTDTEVLVTGGASFIGSHLTEALLERGALVRVVDDLSSGRRRNLAGVSGHERFELILADLLDPGVPAEVTDGMEVVFHLAAAHGGRGYIDHRAMDCSTNLILDSEVFRAAADNGVRKVVYASSGCVYPNRLQSDPSKEVYLSEDQVEPPFDADGLYGWSKLAGELTLSAYVRAGLFEGVPLRYFTAYGPRCPESHAVMAMIARAFVDQSPFEVWGTGEQIRNWTHVDDVVQATILAAERVADGTPINVGTRERIRVADAAREVLAITGKDLLLEFYSDMPTGPYNRVCDTTRSEELLGFRPQIEFVDGLRRTIDWYFENESPEAVRESLEHRLMERTLG